MIRGAILNEDCRYERMPVQIEGDRLFAQKGGIHIIDISEPATPRERGFVSVYGTNMAVEDGAAFVADLDKGLVAFRVQ